MLNSEGSISEGQKVSSGYYHHFYEVDSPGLFEFESTLSACSIAVFDLNNFAAPLEKTDGKLVRHFDPGKYLFVIKVGGPTDYIASFHRI